MTAPDSLPIHRTLAPTEVAPAGTHVVIEADEATRTALARLAGALSVESFRAELEVKPWRHDGFAVSGRVVAALTQACVVTLLPVETRVDETVDVHLVPPEAMARYEEAPDEHGEIEIDLARDMPDPIEGGVVDVGAIAVEHFLLGVEPYPRRPDAVFDAAGQGDGDADASPFAALARLRKE